MATTPGPWSWVPPDWLGGGDVMPAPEMQFPPDDFAGVQPELAAPAEIEMPPDFVGAPPPDIEMPAEYAVDPFAALRAPSAEQPYMGLPVEPMPAEPEPLPPEDAITGVGPIPAAPMLGGLGIPAATFEQAMAGVPMETQGTPELPEEYLANQEAGIAYAMQSPEQQLNQQLDLEQRRADMQRQRMAEASKADAEAAEREEINWRTSRETARRDMEQIDAEAKAEAAREIDINRGWADASTGTKIAGIFSALAGGLVAHKYGGRNSGLEMIDKLIERDIDAQKFNKLQRVNDITRRSGSARDRLAMAGDDFREETRLRLTAYDRVLGQIASDAQNFDPRGTQAIRYGQAYQDLAAKRAQAAFDAQKRVADAYKEQLDFAGKELDLQKKQAELAKAQRAAMGGTGTGKPTKPGDVVQSPDYFKARGLLPPPVAMSENDYDGWQKNKKASSEITSLDNPSGMSKEEREARIPGLTQPDGTPFFALGNTESVTKLRLLKNGTEQAIKRIDDVLRTRTGWSTDMGNSEERAKIGVQIGHAKLAAKGTFDLGAITASDVPLIEGAIGSDDPTKFKDPKPAMLEARRLLIDRLNTEMMGAGYEGPRIEYKEPPTERPVESDEDRILARGLNSEVGSITSFATDDANVNPADRKPRQRIKDIDTSSGIPPTIRAQIDKWEADARSGDEATSAKARAYLLKWAEMGGNAQIRAAAETALTAANTTSPESGPRTSTARDGVDIRGRK